MSQLLTVLTIYAIGATLAALPFIARWWTRAPKPVPVRPRLIVDNSKMVRR